MVLVRQSSFWARTLGLRNTVIQRVEMTDGEDECIIVHVRPRRKAMSRCGICHSAAIEHGLSNALLESTNTKVRLITRVAFGFHSPAALISLVLLSLGGYCPPLPGRA